MAWMLGSGVTFSIASSMPFVWWQGVLDEERVC